MRHCATRVRKVQGWWVKDAVGELLRLHRRVNLHACMGICVRCLLALCTCHIFGCQLSGHTITPVVTQPIEVQSLPLPVVVVERGVTILHVAVFGFFPQFFAVVVRLRLLFVAALILDDVLPTTQTKQTGFTQGTVLKVERFKGRKGNLKSGASYVAWQEFDNHSQNEPGPEDLQNLQHTHQAVEEVEPEEGPVEGQGVHQRRVDDPGKRGQRVQRQLAAHSLLLQSSSNSTHPFKIKLKETQM